MHKCLIYSANITNDLHLTANDNVVYFIIFHDIKRIANARFISEFKICSLNVCVFCVCFFFSRWPFFFFSPSFSSLSYIRPCMLFCRFKFAYQIQLQCKFLGILPLLKAVCVCVCLALVLVVILGWWLFSHLLSPFVISLTWLSSSILPSMLMVFIRENLARRSQFTILRFSVFLLSAPSPHPPRFSWLSRSLASPLPLAWKSNPI